MPPTKKKPSKEVVRDLLFQHKILFEGRASPNQWPRQHQHHFQVIRDISALRYDQWEGDERIDIARRISYGNRVRNLSGQARALLNDLHVNEDTWRTQVEHFVSEPFEKHVICGRCKGELHTADFKADPLERDRREALLEKRSKRQQCRCHSGDVTVRANSDDEDGQIFGSAAGQRLTHCRGDDFQDLSISMSPDRVIGLSCTHRLRRYVARTSPILTHYPITGRQLLYPFLVIEAKKENDAPGFQAIQKQTAFPVRRLLTIQDELRQDSRVHCEPFLVWFFAYQGEEWRLYAGTKGRERVRIYDLWHGTVESHDGALQLLLIADYIWSWARDVYRPSITSCLRGHNGESRDPSPASTNRWRSSASAFSAMSPPPVTQQPNMPTMAQDPASSNENRPPIESQEHEMTDAGDQVRYPNHNPSSHPFLNLASRSPQWTKFASVSHANFVSFTFQVFIFPIYDGSLERLRGSSFYPLYEKRLSIDRYQLGEAAMLWADASISHLSLDNNFSATLVTQFSCDSQWQIERKLTCIVWLPLSLAFEQLLGNQDATFGTLAFLHCVKTLQDIRGKESAWYAVQNTSLILTTPNYPVTDAIIPLPRWLPVESLKANDGRSLEIPNIRSDIRDSDELNDLGVTCLLHVTEPRWIRPSRTQLSISFTPEQDGKPGSARIAIRPDSWGSQYTKFCLFCLEEEGEGYNENTLHRLLNQAEKGRQYYGNVATGGMSPDDKKLLREWLQELKEAG
ncbi:hypothetical protein CC80DRAFT_555718 [Byssothecium circinans]|uniref:Uncharacterized protein n=1 Tax=Byssothecium circinans TaxID=147558 RepID=A0A6A5TAC8_9PLEO|nr:hypothetical protein CC80DRAFT_555718 [Byssothecium circinans]